MSVLIIDNYDSFVYNLARYVVELNNTIKVVRNDQITLADIHAMKPSHIILSPGPCTPNESGICLELIHEFYQSIPLLGVCLGHQAIAQALGGKVVKSKKPMHGKQVSLLHSGTRLFKGLPDPLPVARYHSLVVSDENLPDCLQVTMRSSENEIMAFAHEHLPVYGVQFHPESVLTQEGQRLIQNFLAMSPSDLFGGSTT